MGSILQQHVACFGEVLLRLSAPAGTILLQNAQLSSCIGGAEANVAVALARLGTPSAVISVLPESAIGDAALAALRANAVDISGIQRQPGRMGLYFLTPASVGRPAAVIYDRAASAFCSIAPNDIDWAVILRDAARLHLSGITPALGESSAALALAAARSAKAQNIPVSFDGNFRGQLWAARGIDPAPVLRELVSHADILFGNHRDIALLLGGAAPANARDCALAAFKAFPNLRWIAATSRTVESHDQHRLAARIDTREAAFEAPEVRITGIVDRIGTGDAFVAGVLHDLPQGEAQAVKTGLAIAVIKHGIAGDFCLAGPRELADYHSGATDVAR
jgi:2-dehydro-3-deoxygluconokinase